VHVEAERLEHAVSDDLIERMATALGQPRYDPHGDPIPTAAGEIEEAELVSVADAAPGAKLELRQVGTQDAARLRYLAEQGLTPGVLLTVSERQPFNGPTTLSLVPSGERRIVGRELALLLWCREVPIEAHGHASR
jgi:DtxR family Mn-dependent transcriptional regulator